MKPFVSILVLTYRKFDYIYETLDSVLNQDYWGFELIISDDGSDNLPYDEIERYISEKNDGRMACFSIITSSTNRGTVRNINNAYRTAKGEILIPLAGDDAFYDNSVVTKIVSEFERRNCNVLLTGRALYNLKRDFVRMIPNEREAHILNKLDSNKKQYLRFITHRFFEVYSGGVLYIRKSFIERFGYFDEKYYLLEDAPFFERYLWDNYLECAFDIISIKYYDGGVSSGKEQPLLAKDNELFRTTDKKKHINEIDWISRDIVQYEIERFHKSGFLQKSAVCLKHLFAFIVVKSYKFHKSILERR